MNTIVTWAWKSERDYGLEHVARLAAMLRKHMRTPYRFIAIMDEFGKAPHVKVLKTPAAAKAIDHVRTPEGANFPTSYRRLWLFSREAAKLGEVVLLTDLDVMVTGDWSHLFDFMPEENFIGWKPGQMWGNVETRIGGGTWRLRTGTHPEVWEDFARDPREAVARARAHGFRGSDQAWMSFMLAQKVPIFPESAGICSVRDFTRDNRSKVVYEIPDNACVVHFNGRNKPWHEAGMKQHPWITDYWTGVDW